MCQVSESDFTMSGHLVGMLDRDQRTAKVPTYLKCVQSINNTEKHRNTRYLSHRSRKIFLWKTLQRLKQVLVVGTYLLSIVSIPSSISAPTTLAMDDRYNTHPKWINPCGFGKGAEASVDTGEPPLSASDLIDQIVNQAKSALNKAKQFKEAYTNKMHTMDSMTLNNLFKNVEYDFLPSKSDIPKYLEEPLTENEYLQDLEFDKTLVNIYHEFQKIAVGMEQVVWDQKDRKGVFVDNFTDTEDFLRSVLCEIQMAIIERNLTQKEDIQRDYMPAIARQFTSETQINLRDWIIYRDYMNALEYTIEVFNYIKKNL